MEVHFLLLRLIFTLICSLDILGRALDGLHIFNLLLLLDFIVNLLTLLLLLRYFILLSFLLSLIDFILVVIVVTLRHITVFLHAIAVIRQLFIITRYFFSFLSEFLPVGIILELILTFFLLDLLLLLGFLLVLVSILLLLCFSTVGLLLHWCRLLLIVIIVVIIFISYDICLLLVERYTFLYWLLLISGLLESALSI